MRGTRRGGHERRPRRRRSCGSRAASARRGRRATTGGSPSRSAAASSSSTATAAPGSSSSGSAPPPARPVVSTTSPPTSAASRSARARTASAGSRSIRSAGTSASARSGSRYRSSVPSSAASVSLSGRSARWSGWRRRRPTRSARPRTIPACGPPRSLSPENATRSAPAARLSGTSGSSSNATRLPEPRSSRSGSPRRRATAASSRSDGRSVKPTVRKFDWCDAQQQRRLRPDRRLVVGRARAVRRPDLDEARARAREHVRDPEAVADLDQLAARDDDLAALGERGEREQHGGGVVVDDERVLGAGQPAEHRREVVVPRAARARVEVVLEVRVAAADLGDALRARRRRAARGRGSCAGRRRSR